MRYITTCFKYYGRISRCRKKKALKQMLLLLRVFRNVTFTFYRAFHTRRQERRKDLTDHREDSTFSFDPSKINIKTLTKNKQKRIDARKGVLLSSYTRKKTRRRKRGRSSAGQEKNGGARSRFLYLYLWPALRWLHLSRSLSRNARRRLCDGFLGHARMG